MRMTNKTNAFIIGGIAIGAFGCKQKIHVDKEAQPNVIFFLVDDLGWSDIGCYVDNDFYETPNVDKLAAQGMRFTNAYASCPVCSPTRNSILTGKYPARTGMTDYLKGRRNLDSQPLKMPPVTQNLSLDHVTIAEALRDHGYVTASIGKWHLGEDERAMPGHHGFDTNIGGYWKGFPPSYFDPYENTSNKSNPDIPTLKDQEEGEYLTDRLTNETIRFIETHKDKPFFVYCSHYAVHSPIQAKEEDIEKYKEKLKNLPVQEGPDYILEGNPVKRYSHLNTAKAKDSLLRLDSYKGHGYLPNRMTKIKQKNDNPVYAGMIESIDESLGRIMQKLEELNISENTIVIFMADNGGLSSPDDYATSNLPLRGAKGWLYEGGIREPMIIKWPGHTKPGTVSDAQVTSTDFFPTILEMVKAPLLPEEHVDGVSLVPELEQTGHIQREAIYWHWPHYSNHGQQSPAGVVRYGNFKLIEYYEDSTLQLFNLAEDIGEQHDLLHEMPAKAAKLQQMLDKWRKDVGAKMPEPNPDYKMKEGDVLHRW